MIRLLRWKRNSLSNFDRGFNPQTMGTESDYTLLKLNSTPRQITSLIMPGGILYRKSGKNFNGNPSPGRTFEKDTFLFTNRLFHILIQFFGIEALLHLLIHIGKYNSMQELSMKALRFTII